MNTKPYLIYFFRSTYLITGWLNENFIKTHENLHDHCYELTKEEVTFLQLKYGCVETREQEHFNFVRFINDLSIQDVINLLNNLRPIDKK